MIGSIKMYQWMNYWVILEACYVTYWIHILWGVYPSGGILGAICLCESHGSDHICIVM